MPRVCGAAPAHTVLLVEMQPAATATIDAFGSSQHPNKGVSRATTLVAPLS